MKRTFFIILLITNYSLLIDESFGQTPTWTNIFGGPRTDEVFYVTQTIDGGFLSIGSRTVQQINTQNYINEAYIVKFNFQGTTLWQKVYTDSTIGSGGTMAAEDDFGNFYMDLGIDAVPKLAKLNPQGNVLWERAFSPGVFFFNGIKFTQDKKNLLVLTKLGNFETTPGLTKFDTSGNIIWQRFYSDPNVLSISYDGFIGTNNGYYLVGKTGINIQTNRACIIKIDTSGNEIWRFNFGNNFQFLWSVTQISEGTFGASGSYLLSPGWGGACFVKFTPNNDTLLTKTYINDSLSCGMSIVKTLDNNLAITGCGYYGKARFLKIDTSGNLIFNKVHYYPDSLDLVTYRYINNSSDSGFIIGGVFSIKETDLNCIVVKTDKNGKTTLPLGIINNTEILNNFLISVETYPNPFNPMLTIKLNLLKDSKLNISIYDILGKEMIISSQNNFRKGENKIFINAEDYNMASGVYFVTLLAGSVKLTRKIVLLK
jgi:hypothetical protein